MCCGLQAPGEQRGAGWLVQRPVSGQLALPFWETWGLMLRVASSVHRYCTGPPGSNWANLSGGLRLQASALVRWSPLVCECDVCVCWGAGGAGFGPGLFEGEEGSCVRAGLSPGVLRG